MKTDINANNEKLKRNNRLCINLNEYEINVINKYCEKYQVKNRSKFVREAVILTVLNRFEEDYPSLFEAEQAETLSTK